MPHSQTQTARTFKEIIAIRPEEAARTPGTVLASLAQGVLQPGTVLGLITTGGKLRRYTRAAVKAGGGFTTGATTGSVVDADKIFKVGDVLVVGISGAAMGTIASIVGDLITLTANSTTAAAAGVDIKASDGAENAVGVLLEVVDATVLDRPCALIIGGYLLEDQLVGMNATAKALLGATSRPNNILRF